MGGFVRRRARRKAWPLSGTVDKCMLTKCRGKLRQPLNAKVHPATTRQACKKLSTRRCARNPPRLTHSTNAIHLLDLLRAHQLRKPVMLMLHQEMSTPLEC